VSGSPAFQSTPVAFQQNAFQAGVQVVAGNYYVGSPSFATPALTYHVGLSAAAYSLASPTFATPTLTVLSLSFHIPPYSIGSPSFATPTMRAVHALRVTAYYTGSPVFGTAGLAPPVSQNQILFANTMWVHSPDFGVATYIHDYQLVAPAYSIGAISWSIVGPILVNTFFGRADYIIGSPKFGYPPLQYAPAVSLIPLTYLTQVQQASKVLQTILDMLLASIPVTPISDAGNTVRREINALRANIDVAIRGDTLGTQLQQIFTDVSAAGASYGGIEALRQYLMSQSVSMSIFTQIVFRSALIMTLALESKIIAAINFTNQADVQTMIVSAAAMFDDAKALGIDEIDAITYQTLNSMAGALTYHLASTELQLPRFLTYTSRVRMPSLYLANRIYADASRYQEIEQENAVIHPMFVPQTIRVLSNV
jgi:hypothetical protein